MSTPTLELWQTEWCPASHRARQRLTELGLTYTVHQVPVERCPSATRENHRAADDSNPGRRRQGDRREQAILAYLTEHFTEPADAAEQRTKAANAKQRELEETCPKLAAATH